MEVKLTRTKPRQIDDLVQNCNVDSAVLRQAIEITLKCKPCAFLVIDFMQCMHMFVIISVTSHERHGVFYQQFVQQPFQVNIKAPHYWPFLGGVLR